MKHFAGMTIAALMLIQLDARAERINQEGRILGPLPVVTNAVLFNTSNADAIVSAMQIFPVTNPWNESISNRPVLANSDAMIAQINSNLAAHPYLIAEYEMNFAIVPDVQPLVSNKFVTYPDDSDLNGGIFPYGLYPTPTNMPIEEWPKGTGSQTVLQWQTNNLTGHDRHSIIVQPGAGLIYETWKALRVGTNWQAANGAIFNLNSNALREEGLTSGDAAGLPMFPALVRFDECERGMVEHACRIVVNKSLKAYIYPATHYASSLTNGDYPPMGQRLRLKASYVIPNSYTKQEKAVLLALKKYGALVADNGSFFSISVTPDDRWPANCFQNLTNVGITNFEAIQATGVNEGPRSPGAPTADAGADASATVGSPVQLQGVVNFSGALPIIQWKKYSGPGTVNFSDASQTNATATFSAPGTYTLMLSADDGVHAVAYDAVIINLTSNIALSATASGTNLDLSWLGGTAPFVLESTTNLATGNWNSIATTGVQNISIPMTNGNEFFRLKAN